MFDKKVMNFQTRIADSLKLFFLMIVRNSYQRTALFCQKMAEKYDKNNSTLLDVGAGSLPNRKYFKNISYLSQDVVQNKKRSIKYVCDINEGITEIKSSTIDFILSTQVLEHIREPHKVFKEFNRLLKVNGRVFLTTNMCYEEHMIPYDYFRYTKYGLRYLAESSGFEVESIKPQGGYFQVLYYLIFNLPIFIFIKRGSILYYLYLLIFIAPFFLFGVIAYFLDILDFKKNITINYECVFRKRKNV